jgi:hypothetical protein
VTVFVDSADIPYRRMLMCHLIADTLAELHAMAARIGVQRRWFQPCPPHSFPHYDICQTKKALALAAGAVEVDRRRLAAHMKRIRAGGAAAGLM